LFKLENTDEIWSKNINTLSTGMLIRARKKLEAKNKERKEEGQAPLAT